MNWGELTRSHRSLLVGRFSISHWIVSNRTVQHWFLLGSSSLFLSFLLLSLYVIIVIIIIGIIIFHFISAIELFLSQPTSFTCSFLLFLLPSSQGVRGLSKDCTVLSCQLGLNHDTSLKRHIFIRGIWMLFDGFSVRKGLPVAEPNFSWAAHKPTAQSLIHVWSITQEMPVWQLPDPSTQSVRSHFLQFFSSKLCSSE